MCFSVLLAIWSPCLGKRELVFVLIVHLFVSYAHVNLCHFFSSTWCRRLAAASACGSSWTFLFTSLPSDSTVNQLTDLYNTFCQALDEGKEVRAVFCDISKAFDRVWHKGLLYKHSSVGISGPLLQWFTDYLDNRKQRDVLPGTASSWTSLKTFLKVIYLALFSF